MTASNNWVECVPNISSSDAKLIKDFQETCSKSDDVFLLHTDSNQAIDRTVFTLVGSLQGIFTILHALYNLVAEKIDLRNYVSVHPHIGSVDVCPFILLSGITYDDALQQIRIWYQEVSHNHRLPIFEYQPDTNRPHQKHLVYYRRGGLKRLANRMATKQLQPDFGPHQINPRLGASIVGIRNLMIAYNINLESNQEALAKDIASFIRSTNPESPFRGLKAIGWYAEDFERAQISINMYEVQEGLLSSVYLHCKTLAADKNIALMGSELIGLVPIRAMARNLTIDTPKDKIEQISADLGLNAVKPFNPREHILDFCFLDKVGIKFSF